MANPYPMQGQMMQPMGGPPMGPQNAPRPVVRRGTSKAVPVVISMGLAVGVFCGLLFGVGIPEEVSAAPTSEPATTPAPKKADADVPDPFAPQKKDVKVPSLAPQAVKDGSAAPAKDGSAAQVATGSDKPAAGSNAGTPAAGSNAGKPPATPTKVVGTLKVEVLPEAASKIAKVNIDGKDIDGLTYELDMSDLAKSAKPDTKKDDIKKELKVTVRASGYIDRQTKIEVIAERDTTLKIDLVKRATGSGLPRPTVPTGGGNPNNGGNTTKPPPPKCKKPPCGLIDI